jgi:hypothetical protein
MSALRDGNEMLHEARWRRDSDTVHWFCAALIENTPLDSHDSHANAFFALRRATRLPVVTNRNAFAHHRMEIK